VAKKGLPKRKYEWDLTKHGMTQSALKEYLNCPEHFYLSYIEGWTATEISGPLLFGTQVHDMIDKTGDNPDTLSTVYESMGESIMEHRGFNATTRQRYLDSLDLAYVVLLGYYKHWEKFNSGRVWIAREKSFRVATKEISPLNVMVSKACEIPLRGKWDGLYFKKTRAKNPPICQQEIKTAGRVDEATLQASLHLDFQSMFYAYAFLLEHGQVPALTLRDVIRRPQLRRGKTEERNEFLDRVSADVSKRPTFYFMRWETKLTEKSVMTWYYKTLMGVLEQFYNWHEALLGTCELGIDQDSLKWDPSDDAYLRWGSSLHYMNPEALTRKMGTLSQFFHLLTRGSYYGLYRRSTPHPELDD